jgi:pimeloyl-ACP methyl ester carboxylesterase
VARSSKTQDQARLAPRLRRAYYDCRYGQLHLHNAIPGGGGFDELTAVICLHDVGETGRVFMPLLVPLGEARSVYALDLPGAGESDPAPGVDAVASAVHAAIDFADSMRIRTFDLLVRGTISPAALQLLELRGAAIRRVVALGADGMRSGPKLTVLTAAEAASPQLPSRILDLLKAGA